MHLCWEPNKLFVIPPFLFKLVIHSVTHSTSVTRLCFTLWMPSTFHPMRDWLCHQAILFPHITIWSSLCLVHTLIETHKHTHRSAAELFGFLIAAGEDTVFLFSLWSARPQKSEQIQSALMPCRQKPKAHIVVFEELRISALINIPIPHRAQNVCDRQNGKCIGTGWWSTLYNVFNNLYLPYMYKLLSKGLWGFADAFRDICKHWSPSNHEWFHCTLICFFFLPKQYAWKRAQI